MNTLVCPLDCRKSSFSLALFQGTSTVSYPNYPAFAPHSAFDFGDYNAPAVQLAAVSSSPVPFLDELMRARGGWVRFSGAANCVCWGVNCGQLWVNCGQLWQVERRAYGSTKIVLLRWGTPWGI